MSKDTEGRKSLTKAQRVSRIRPPRKRHGREVTGVAPVRICLYHACSVYAFLTKPGSAMTMILTQMEQQARPDRLKDWVLVRNFAAGVSSLRSWIFEVADDQHQRVRGIELARRLTMREVSC
jgi:hypothetical protein